MSPYMLPPFTCAALLGVASTAAASGGPAFATAEAHPCLLEPTIGSLLACDTSVVAIGVEAAETTFQDIGEFLCERNMCNLSA